MIGQTTVTLALLTVLINRDPTVTIPVQFFEYELPVIEEIHGELSVSVASSKDVTVPAFSAADAYAQLLRKYAQHPEAVKAIYRNPKALAKESGLSYESGDDQSTRYQQSEVVVHDNTAEAPAVDVAEPDASAPARARARAQAEAAPKQ